MFQPLSETEFFSNKFAERKKKSFKAIAPNPNPLQVKFMFPKQKIISATTKYYKIIKSIYMYLIITFAPIII